jgi:kynurenine formamidase
MSASDPSRREVLAAAGAMAIASSVAGTATAQPADAAHPPLTKADIDRMAQKVSNAGRWGADDQLGTLNLITPAKRKQALALATHGTTVSLAHEQSTEKSDDNRQPLIQTIRPPNFKPGEATTFVFETYTMNYHGGYFTHMDALGHCFYDGISYNGATPEIASEHGLSKLSIMTSSNGVVTRGVLMDIPRLKNLPYLEPTDIVYPEDLDGWEKKAGIKVTSGDAIFIRTGRWARRKDKGSWNAASQGAGLHSSCAEWMHARDVGILGTDDVGDKAPSPVPGVFNPVHSLVLARMGTPMIDDCDLEAVSETANQLKRWTFLMMVAPMVIPTGTGSPVNPIAIF